MSPEQLRALRKINAWTQQQAAEKIGIEQSYLSKLENGLFVPSTELAAKIASVYSNDNLGSNNGKRVSRLINTLLIFFSVTAPVLFLVAALELVFINTFYTYESERLSQRGEQLVLVPRIYVTDQYQGEIFNQAFDNEMWRFNLVAERTVSRRENRWCYFISAIFALTAGFLFLMKTYVVRRK